jgi:hypothetical protein
MRLVINLFKSRACGSQWYYVDCDARQKDRVLEKRKTHMKNMHVLQMEGNTG